MMLKQKDYVEFVNQSEELLNYLLEKSISSSQMQKIIHSYLEEPEEAIINQMRLTHLERTRKMSQDNIEVPPRKKSKKDHDPNFEVEENLTKRKKKVKEKRVEEQPFKIDKFLKETLKARLSEKSFSEFKKIIHLFSMFIISSAEALSFLQQFNLTERQFSFIKQHIESIQNSNRAQVSAITVCSITPKTVNSGVSPSYDFQPLTYANICSTKT